MHQLSTVQRSNQLACSAVPVGWTESKMCGGNGWQARTEVTPRIYIHFTSRLFQSVGN